MSEGQEPRETSGLAWLAPYAVVLGLVLVIVVAVTASYYVLVAVVLLLLAPVVRWRYLDVRRRENQGEYVSDLWRNDTLLGRRPRRNDDDRGWR